MPSSIINNAVYTSLRRGALTQALALATLQALINSSNPNSWDTFGEVYYFMGEEKLARKYEMQSRRIDKSFTQGGEEHWKKELEQFRRR